MPLPLAPLVTLIHLTLLVAVHWQPLAAVTLPVPVPPVPATASVNGATVAVHCVENANVFDRVLALEPPGPFLKLSLSKILGAAVVSFLVMAVLGIMGSRRLSKAGYKTGLFGASKADVRYLGAMGASERLQSTTLAWGTFVVAAGSSLVALPIGLLSAIYLSEYAPFALRELLKPVLELLSAVPTVIRRMSQPVCCESADKSDAMDDDDVVSAPQSPIRLSDALWRAHGGAFGGPHGDAMARTRPISRGGTSL